MKPTAWTPFVLVAVAVAWTAPLVAAPGAPVAEAVTLPGSEKSLTQKQIDNPHDPADWYPELHPPMPDIVRHGDREKGLWACSLCHLASGYGHPESAALPGLSEEYLYKQLKAFQNWHRADWSGAMFLFLWGYEDDDLREAAKYFSAIEPGPVVRVVETEVVPETFIDVGWRTKIKDPENPKSEPIGQRLITLPDSEFLRTKRHPYATFVSYVPPGSLALGKAIAEEGTDSSAACVTCHGQDMKGTEMGPFIAGQFPDYLLRQLRAFKWGTRRESGDQNGEMQQEVRYLSEQELLAVSAYVASLPRGEAVMTIGRSGQDRPIVESPSD